MCPLVLPWFVDEDLETINRQGPISTKTHYTPKQSIDPMATPVAISSVATKKKSQRRDQVALTVTQTDMFRDIVKTAAYYKRFIFCMKFYPGFCFCTSVRGLHQHIVVVRAFVSVHQNCLVAKCLVIWVRFLLVCLLVYYYWVGDLDCVKSEDTMISAKTSTTMADLCLITGLEKIHYI